jgi:hypothetical protein
MSMVQVVPFQDSMSGVYPLAASIEYPTPVQTSGPGQDSATSTPLGRPCVGTVCTVHPVPP